MKDRLSGYREAMDRSIFKGEKFTSHHKQKVLGEIKKGRKKSGDWLPRTLSAAFGIILLLIGGYFLFEVTADPAEQAESSHQSKPASNGDESTPSAIGEGEENRDGGESQDSDKEAVLESPYKEVKGYFDSYELPEEGRVESSEFINSVEYENGYTFNQGTKAMVGRVHGEGGPAEPTEGQKIGVIMGLLGDAAAIEEPENRTISNAPNQMQFPLSRLAQIKELNEFEPLKEWLIETENIFKLVETSESEEESRKMYEEGYKRLQKMSSLIEGK